MASAMTNPILTRAEVEALADFVENSIGGFISRKLLLHISIALRAYAATLDAPQAAPATCKEGLQVQAALVAEGKPDFDAIVQRLAGEHHPLFQDSLHDELCALANAVAAEAHKAAEAKIAEMREACAEKAVEYMRAYSKGSVQRAGSMEGIGARIADELRAIPNPSDDRFMRLLEAAQEAQDDLAQVGDGLEAQGIVSNRLEMARHKIRRALAAFEQPEKQP